MDEWNVFHLFCLLPVHSKTSASTLFSVLTWQLKLCSETLFIKLIISYFLSQTECRIFVTCRSSASLLKLVGDGVLADGHLFIPGIKNALTFKVSQWYCIRMNLLNVSLRCFHTEGVLLLSTNHTHQQQVDRIRVHEVDVSPLSLWQRSLRHIIWCKAWLLLKCDKRYSNISYQIFI